MRAFILWCVLRVHICSVIQWHDGCVKMCCPKVCMYFDWTKWLLAFLLHDVLVIPHCCTARRYVGSWKKICTSTMTHCTAGNMTLRSIEKTLKERSVIPPIKTGCDICFDFGLITLWLSDKVLVLCVKRVHVHCPNRWSKCGARVRLAILSGFLK